MLQYVTCNITALPGLSTDLKGGAAQLPSPLPAPRSPALATPTSQTPATSNSCILTFIALSFRSEIFLKKWRIKTLELNDNVNIKAGGSRQIRSETTLWPGVSVSRFVVRSSAPVVLICCSVFCFFFILSFFLDRFLGRERVFFLVFFLSWSLSWTEACFLTFLLSFINSHLRSYFRSKI